MTDTFPADANMGAPAGGPAPGGFRILAQYVRDLSFENPRAPESLRVEAKPAIDLGVELAAQGRPDNLFEVIVKLSVKATTDAPIFQVELEYAGLFQLNPIKEADVEPMLLIECPRYLFPFARQIIAQATADGGFYPPFLLDPIDFAQIYINRQQQIAAGPQDQGQA